GFTTVLKVYLAYLLPGDNGVRMLKIGEKKVSGEGPVRAEFRADGLWKGFKYQIYTHSDRAKYGDDIDTYEYLREFSTGGDPGHNPPQFENVAMRVPIGSTKSITKLVTAIDPDGDAIEI